LAPLLWLFAIDYSLSKVLTIGGHEKSPTIWLGIDVDLPI